MKKVQISLFVILFAVLWLCGCGDFQKKNNDGSEKTTSSAASGKAEENGGSEDLLILFEKDSEKVNSEYTKAIVEGEVLSSEKIYYADDRDWYVLSKIAVDKVLKGDVCRGDVITVSECCRYNYKVMEKGQKAALFLDKTSDPEYEKEFSNGTAFFTVLGAYQGKYIYTDGKYINCTPDDIGNVERTIYTEESFEEMVYDNML